MEVQPLKGSLQCDKCQKITWTCCKFVFDMNRSVYFQFLIAQNFIFAQNSQKECIKEISQLHKTFFPIATPTAAQGANPKPVICDHCCCDDLNYDTFSCQYLKWGKFHQNLTENGLKVDRKQTGRVRNRTEIGPELDRKVFLI